MKEVHEERKRAGSERLRGEVLKGVWSELKESLDIFSLEKLAVIKWFKSWQPYIDLYVWKIILTIMWIFVKLGRPWEVISVVQVTDE